MTIALIILLLVLAATIAGTILQIRYDGPRRAPRSHGADADFLPPSGLLSR